MARVSFWGIKGSCKSFERGLLDTEKERSFNSEVTGAYSGKQDWEDTPSNCSIFGITYMAEALAEGYCYDLRRRHSGLS